MWHVLVLAACAAPQWLGPAPAASKRIVSLAPSATELLFALGAGEQVVGVTQFDDTPEQVKTLPKVGGFNTPDLEAIAALHPDWVVAVPTSAGRGRMDALARLNIPVLVLPAQTLPELWEAMDSLGGALHREDQAKQLKNDTQQALRALQERLHMAHPKPLHVLVVVGRKPLVGAGPGSFIDALLAYAQGDNVLTRGGPFPVLDMEAVVTLKPDVIVDLAHASEGQGFDAFWRQAPAHGRAVHLDDTALVRPGPRLVTALTELAEALWEDPAIAGGSGSGGGSGEAKKP